MRASAPSAWFQVRRKGQTTIIAISKRKIRVQQCVAAASRPVSWRSRSRKYREGELGAHCFLPSTSAARRNEATATMVPHFPARRRVPASAFRLFVDLRLRTRLCYKDWQHRTHSLGFRSPPTYPSVHLNSYHPPTQPNDAVLHLRSLCLVFRVFPCCPCTRGRPLRRLAHIAIGGYHCGSHQASRRRQAHYDLCLDARHPPRGYPHQ